QSPGARCRASGAAAADPVRPDPGRPVDPHDHRSRNREGNIAAAGDGARGGAVMTLTTARQRKLAYAAWVAVCLIWGTTYFGIRISLETMPPGLMGGLRWSLAGGLLAIVLALQGARPPARSSWGSITLLGFLMLVLGNGGVVVAEQWLPSGLTAVLVAT